MLILKIAIRSLLRRKSRIAMIGGLVLVGTLLLVFGEIFAHSSKVSSKNAIINYFTGDLVLYSARAKEKPSPFSFTTPLPILENPALLEDWLGKNEMVKAHVAIAQNYGVMSVQKKGLKVEVPFIFYAVDPVKYASVFDNCEPASGTFYNVNGTGPSTGVVLSTFQQQNYLSNYGVEINPGDDVTLLSLTEGASVNTYPSKVVGIYEPKHYKNVFDYISFLDITSYSRLYNFTGVESSSLPTELNDALNTTSEDDIFALSGSSAFDLVDTDKLIKQELTGYTILAVKLKNSKHLKKFEKEITEKNFKVKVAPWNESAGFFASVSLILEGIIYGATFLIFLVVIFILMNTLIINVLERTAEIGTLRALGGEKSFITSIFLVESFLLNASAAIIGMLLSLLLVFIFRGGVPLPEIVSQYLIGGGNLKLQITLRPFLQAAVLITIVSILATLYPIRVATQVTPLKAMSNK